ncbi:ExbD/TolR family protein [Spirochaeta cellobiosiphila]|uniref:ExbD/TolR family protein n=1 Tax=Spirochaeta cellobiosiphila TaxID=504483 RepID=UPI0004100893|nr:biopolymer transporter ExbD [Spirochaeta cellobiosiphila]
MRFRRNLTPNAKVDLVPMIDVVFQLVVFFMVSSTFNLTPAISLILPGSTTADVVQVTQLTVTVIDSDQIYLNKESYSMDQLGAALAKYSQEDRAQFDSIILQGDATTSYATIIEVMDVLRLNGFKGIQLKTREVQD